ncbi:hypothetical protein CYMTET_45331 [Cymbomonas tetramitiformis]|uniref:Uncharacterized protein n=1 Tax=Cymbomonas tetramitiformis TaxID=36881 RepID=A0AAE0BZQ2_9CHLO|nr:hypothetical protein CYMTET_45331 [Cymbomonas tetramitiformis]
MCEGKESGGKYEVGGGEEALADGGSEEVGEEVGEKVGLVVEEASEGKGGDISQGGEEVEDEAGEEVGLNNNKTFTLAKGTKS